MNQESRLRVETYLNDFRAWSFNHIFQKCRLVQYSGFEFAGAIDVPLDAIEREMSGCLDEGFSVAWALNAECLVLVVWESWNLPVQWNPVFEERDFEVPDSDQQFVLLSP